MTTFQITDGSEKQIAWANDIAAQFKERAEAYRQWRDALIAKKSRAAYSDAELALSEEIIEMINQQTDARFWIDSRSNTTGVDIFHALHWILGNDQVNEWLWERLGETGKYQKPGLRRVWSNHMNSALKPAN